ncbi:MAG: hypothetical protein NC930_08510, partial [Candidatus Omnitrophica bacterium]|nr:hypothetical protein [Candidatus Omnitrophota bacterium]
MIAFISLAVLSRPAFAVLTYSDFAVYAAGQVRIGENSKIQDTSDPDGVYTGKVGTHKPASDAGYSLDLDALVIAGDLYSAGDTRVGQLARITGDIVSDGNLNVQSLVNVSGSINTFGTGTFGDLASLSGN